MQSNIDLVKSPRLWFPGGTVVFRTENTIHRLFPVILSSCSPVFQAMFGVPQPSTQENYDDLPLVTMMDQEKDLTVLFEAIYLPHTSLIFMPKLIDNDPKDALRMILGILRLSTKYQIDHLRYHSLRLLHAVYVPFTLEETTGDRTQADLSEALSIIPVARECNAQWLLPGLFKLACELPRGKWHNFQDFEAANVHFSDQRLILRGRAQLLSVNNEEVCGPLRETCEADVDECNVWRLKLLDDWLGGCPYERIDASDLEMLCVQCRGNIGEDMKAAQRSAWNDLPSLFELPSWQELTVQRDIDLGYSPNKAMAAL